MVRTLKVAVVERDTDAVQAKALEERGILLGEEVLEELNTTTSAMYNRCEYYYQRTLSKKRSLFFSPTTSARAERIWFSHPGYPGRSQTTSGVHARSDAYQR